MKTMAILAVLVGLLEAANAASEAWAAGLRAGNGSWLAGIVLVVLAGTLLVVAGVALLRRTRPAVSLARAAAIATLAVVVLVRVAEPWMSIVATVLGIVFPVALLAFLQWRRPGPEVPTAA